MLLLIPLHFLCTHFLQLVHCIELLQKPLPQTPHGHLTLLHYLLSFPTNHNLGYIHINSQGPGGHKTVVV